MTVREQTEQIENQFLSDRACRASAAARDREEQPCPLRTAFQQDRDRILHCTSFRRLKRKTQVFLSPIGDHYRTRLTHTLEVAQIARTMARALRMNEDLTEAIALGHDLGHSPFGHAGEAILNEICPHGYRHYEQSVRVVDYIEKNGRGLNLTQAVRNGILCHTNKTADTLEGNIVRVSDRIAYINHDIEDAVRAGVLHSGDLPAHAVEVLGATHTERITTLISAVVAHGTDSIGMAPDIQAAMDELRSFMFEHVYLNPVAKSEEGKVERMICMLYEYYVKNIGEMPPEYIALIEDRGEEEQRVVCDYISGMTDQYSIDRFDQLFVPKSWRV
jgi:dGTPase